MFVEAVLYRYRAGIPWRDLPEKLGDFRVVHLRHTRWSKKGIWGKIFKILVEDADNQWVFIDSTIVRAIKIVQEQKKVNSSNEEQAIGRSSEGLSTKIHTNCDALGNPTNLHLSQGQVHDLEGADVLMDALTKAKFVLADKAYDADKRVREKLQ